MKNGSDFRRSVRLIVLMIEQISADGKIKCFFLFIENIHTKIKNDISRACKFRHWYCCYQWYAMAYH